MIAPVLAAILAVQSPQNATQPVTVEEYLDLRRPMEVRVSPSGTRTAFTVAELYRATGEFRTTLYLWESGRGTRHITPGFGHVSSPRMSQATDYVAFLSTGRATAPDSTPQLWLYAFRSGSEPTRLGDFPTGVVDFDWGPDGSIYALTTNGTSGEREFWRVQAPQGSAEYIWGGDSGIRELAVSPDGGSIVFSTNGTGQIDDYLNYNLRILDLESQRSRELTNRPGSEVSPVWSPDGLTVAFRAPLNPRYPYSQVELFAVPAAGGTANNLTDSFDRTVVDHVWPADGGLLFTAAIGTHTQIFAAREDGAVQAVTRGDYNFGPFHVADGAIYAIRQSGSEAAELWRVDDSRLEQLTELNDATQGWRLGRQEVIEWVAPDGLNIEGVLVYPVDYEEGRRYPLLVSVAGGPLSRATNVIDQPEVHHLFAAHGYAVLAPNFRGSAGYGEDFATANREDLAGGDLIDMLAGIDHVIDLGLADPGKIAVLGGAATPFGAFLASWAVTQTPRFDAGILDYHVATPFGEPLAHNTLGPKISLFEAGFLEILERERSPIDEARSVQTPLLILDGDAGTLVSRPQRLHRTLTDLNRAVEYADYSTETEAPTSAGGFVDLFFRQLRWLDRYLKFGGADLYDFYRVGESVPGPGGWQLRVSNVEFRSDYSGLQPDSGRYLEITIDLEPRNEAVDDGSLQALNLDPEEGLAFLDRLGNAQPFAGTVTEMFALETLIMGAPAPITLAIPEAGPPDTLSVRLVFELPDDAGEYRLRITGFVPVRIWLPASTDAVD
jgi:dipeptidyl aminopeptidase/acylaminoacyl peptidase